MNSFQSSKTTVTGLKFTDGDYNYESLWTNYKLEITYNLISVYGWFLLGKPSFTLHRLRKRYANLGEDGGLNFLHFISWGKFLCILDF